MRKRFPPLFLVGLAFSLGFIALGFLLASPAEIFRGLFTILTEQDLLITDYFYLAGIGPALVNAGLVTLASILLIQLSGDAYNGFTLVELSLMAGFALFGKNLLNITPILLGTWCYARYQHEPFSKYVGVGLLSTALSPLISFLAFGSIHASLPLAFAAGMLLGFLLPPLSAYTYKIQNGMNLYNMGFACGLLAMMIVPALTAFGDRPTQVLYWYDQHQTEIILAMDGFCLLLICLGLMATGKRRKEVWADYLRLLGTTGRVPSDYLRMFGPGAVLVNAGINGLFGMVYLFLIDGQFNGPTIGGLLAIMGFSAGGHLAAHYTTCFDCPEVRSVFPRSKAVQACVLCYPVIAANPRFAHMGSFENLLGHCPLTPEEESRFSCQNQVTAHTPPTFLWHTAPDDCVPVMNSLVYAQALAEHGVPFTLHVYPWGWHGLSTVDSQTNVPLEPKVALASEWMAAAKQWLRLTLEG